MASSLRAEYQMNREGAVSRYSNDSNDKYGKEKLKKKWDGKTLQWGSHGLFVSVSKNVFFVKHGHCGHIARPNSTRRPSLFMSKFIASFLLFLCTSISVFFFPLEGEGKNYGSLSISKNGNTRLQRNENLHKLRRTSRSNEDSKARLAGDRKNN